MARTRCDRTPVWVQLRAAFDANGRQMDLREAFAQDSARFQRFSQQAPHVFADLSKNRIDADTEALLLQLAQECGLEAYRDAMFAGEPINNTENRAVAHVWLRKPPPAPADTAQPAIDFVATEQAKVHATLTAMLAYAEAVRADAGHYRHREHRHRWLRPGPADGGAGLAGLCAPGQTPALREQRGRA